MDRLYEIAEEFKRSLKDHHEEEFENTTIEDMRKEIHGIQLLRDKTNNLMDMNRLRMFLDGTEELEKVLLHLEFPGTKGVMSIVWGSVRFLLRSTNTTDRAFDGVLDVYGLLGAHLLPLTQFEESFQRFPFAIECIVNIYHDIQRFHSTAYRLFSLTAQLWQRLQKSIWDDASSLFSRLSDSLGSHAKFIKEHSLSTQDYDAVHAAFQQYSYSLKGGWKNFETEEKFRRHERKYKVTEWITSSQKMPRLQNDFREMAICSKSGRWLFRNYSDISEWMGEEDPPHSAIWLHGNVGYGILLQMVEAEDYIIPYCYQEKVTSGGSILIDAKLAQKLIKTFIEFSARHYIVIDGVDECHGTEIQQTAEFFKDLVSAYDTQIRLGHLRVIFIGRETSDTKKHVTGDDCFSIALRPEDNHDDIRAFVQKKLPEFSKSSHGVGFSLSEADKYERLLDSVKNSLMTQQGGSLRWERSKLLFGWLICAKRPLRWHEMQAILCFNPYKLHIDFENNMLRQDMEKYLGSIVHVLDGGYIRLIHSTARRYIIENRHIREKQVQCQLTTMCLRYLTLPCFIGDTNYRAHQRSEDAKLGWFSFQDYACAHWLYHIDTVIRECSEAFRDQTFQEVAADFASALKHFVNTHRANLTTTKHAELVEDHIEKFVGLELYQDLHLLWNHIYTHQRGDYASRNTVGVKQIENGLKDNRKQLEIFRPDQKAGDEDTIADYYGASLFKCNRTLCRFFYVGYNNERDRHDHGKRHERPFQCPLSCNAAPLGFVSGKDRDRHVNIYHPERSDGPAIFEALSRRQIPDTRKERILIEE
ncbi:hypothetical protein FGADI_3276 [Fusarium gaditjirri]|uniref:Uncharacterized protein n=1 Tax=Fusarium gaditjirri TaxID=282569 RepID=A0A8H4X190_9HYPO|nr:hypothetical protein FGADI_3276 [Fusarium gaditjirri]